MTQVPGNNKLNPGTQCVNACMPGMMTADQARLDHLVNRLLSSSLILVIFIIADSLSRLSSIAVHSRIDDLRRYIVIRA